MSKLKDVMFVMNANPNVKAASIAEKFGLSKAYVYVLMSEARKKLNLTKQRDGSWKQKLRMQGTTQPATRDEKIVNPGVYETVAVIPDAVNHPAHYKVGGIETIDFIEAKQLNYNLGNVVKYLTRADHKGNALEDLNKARWYLNREIAKLTK
jgi:DNA-binding CsgD family transcriptional regulator